jgi:hypothetical protein
MLLCSTSFWLLSLLLQIVNSARFQELKAVMTTEGLQLYDAQKCTAVILLSCDMQ